MGLLLRSHRPLEHRGVGWSITDHSRSELVVDALDMARWQRSPDGTIVHADWGVHYTSWVFGHRLRGAGLLVSMGRVASSVDNALVESVWSTMNASLSTASTGPHASNLPARPSSGSKVGTTLAASTRRWECCHHIDAKHCTLPPKERHNQRAENVRITRLSSMPSRSRCNSAASMRWLCSTSPFRRGVRGLM